MGSSITMTNHAAARKQQRGISESVLDCLLAFGKASHDNRGGEVLYFANAPGNLSPLRMALPWL